MESGDRRAELTLGALTPASGVREVEEQPGNEDATARQRRRVPAEQEKQQEIDQLKSQITNLQNQGNHFLFFSII